METFDVIVIGAGPAGENTTGRCAHGGLPVAIVGRELVGSATVSPVWLRSLEADGR